ncbi:unnamed protein product [Lampetra fluviatilis]
MAAVNELVAEWGLDCAGSDLYWIAGFIIITITTTTIITVVVIIFIDFSLGGRRGAKGKETSKRASDALSREGALPYSRALGLAFHAEPDVSESED